MSSTQPPLRYQPRFEEAPAGEQEAVDGLKEVFAGMSRTVADHEGHAFRAVHAKGHALLRGQLRVPGGLDADYAQGLFARAADYPVLVRVSSPPAEQLPDSVSTPRALAIKVLGVQGERAPGGGEAHTQDFLMVNGPAFSAPGPAAFLRAARLLAATTERMPRTKKAISATLRGTGALLESLGGESARLKGMGGEPREHPLGETFFTQVPFLYGSCMAKFSLAPRSPALLALENAALPDGDDAQREAIATFFRELDAPVEWDLRAQLCRDLERMPIEDPTVEWPEALSPWQTVARLVVPPQDAWSESAQADEDSLAFSPWHALAAHRPLGGINRARRQVMEVSRRFRAEFNRCPIHEPRAGRDGALARPPGGS